MRSPAVSNLTAGISEFIPYSASLRLPGAALTKRGGDHPSGFFIRSLLAKGGGGNGCQARCTAGRGSYVARPAAVQRWMLTKNIAAVRSPSTAPARQEFGKPCACHRRTTRTAREQFFTMRIARSRNCSGPFFLT